MKEITRPRRLNLRKGDTVQVITGNDRGTRGRILKAFPRTKTVVVEGVNVRKKHQRAQQAGRSQTQAGIVQFEAPVNVSNVMLVCPKCDKITRISVQRESGNRTRVCKKCGEGID
jgi:large subunit ribosomal protein L24